MYYDEPDWSSVSFEYLQRELARLQGLLEQPWLLRSAVSGVVRVSPDSLVAHSDGRLSREDLLAECLRTAAEDTDQPWDFRQGALKVLQGTWMALLGYIAEGPEGYSATCTCWCDTEHSQLARAARNAQEAAQRARAGRLAQIKAQLRAKARERRDTQTRLEDNPEVAAHTEAQLGRTPRHIADSPGQWARQHAERAAARELPESLEEVYETAFQEAASALALHTGHRPNPRGGLPRGDFDQRPDRAQRAQKPTKGSDLLTSTKVEHSQRLVHDRAGGRRQLQLQAQDGTLRLERHSHRAATAAPDSAQRACELRARHARGIADRAIRAAERLLGQRLYPRVDAEQIIQHAGGVDRFLDLVA